MLPIRLASLAFLAAPVAAAWTPLAYDQSRAPVDNPLKGFIPYEGEYADFPHSMEFNYVGMADLMDGPSSFTFASGLEPLLQGAASRGHQVVFRVFLDYPDEATSIPQFLLDAGLATTPYAQHGGGLSPDYEDEDLVVAMESLIAALGAACDADPRIGFVQVGLLGHWGEWHTYPQDALFPGVAVQNRILAAFDAAFDETCIVVSQDSMGQSPMANLAATAVGFHDDAFVEGTLAEEEWMFHARIVANGFADRWKTLPVGGEILPDHQSSVWNLPSGAPQDYAACVTTTRASWLLNHAAFDNSWSAAKRQRAVGGARLLGYELYVAEANSEYTSSHLSVGVRVRNEGVAPFYYAWPVEIALLDAGDAVVESWTPSWDLRTAIPGDPAVEWTATFPASVQPGHRVALRVPNPMAGGKPLLFVNAEQGATWLVLGTPTPALAAAVDAWCVE